MKVKCPTCKRWTEWQNNPYKPFCSERCKLVDLGAWVTEEFKIEGDKIPEEVQKDEE